MKNFLKYITIAIISIIATFTILYNLFINAEMTTTEYDEFTILTINILGQNFVFELNTEN